jgi:TRAP-type C4-dicarboxylate transport system permease small subunit
MSYLKKSILSNIPTVGIIAAPAIALAQTDKLTPTAINVLAALNVVVSIIFVIAVIVFGWGIVKLIIASGNPEEIKKAKGFLIWGIVGIAVLASVFGIITYLQEFFGVTAGSGTIETPAVSPPQ